MNMRISIMNKPLIVLLFAVVAQGVQGTPSPYQPPHAPATKSAYLKLPPGAVEPQGWLRDWCEQVRDGFTGRMEDVHPAFKQAWAADYRITGPNLYWGKGAGRMRVAGTGLRGWLCMAAVEGLVGLRPPLANQKLCRTLGGSSAALGKISP